MSALPKPVEIALCGLPEPLRDPASAWVERFASEHGSGGLSPALVRLAAVSEFAGGTLLRQWPRFRESGRDPLALPDRSIVAAALAGIVHIDADAAEVKRGLRRLRQRYLTLILARELGSRAALDATLSDWSWFADAVFAAVHAYAERRVKRRFGGITDRDGRPISCVVLAMGKLGGGELNVSSDVDVVFLFSADGASTGRQSVPAQIWFTRLSQQIVALVHELTAEGFVFRVDTRLRPFGDSGAPVTSFAALEAYLLNHGRTWERYAYIKARPVGPRLPAAIDAELMAGLIQPFVYRRYLDYGIFEALREMHGLLAKDGKRRELSNNLKLGPGGIREIEFIVQSLQLLRGGRRTELRSPSLLDVLPKLARARVLSRADCGALEASYTLLRRAENFVQGLRDQQTHDLPASERDRARLALAMGEPDWGNLASKLDDARSIVREQFARLVFGAPPAGATGRGIRGLWRVAASRDEWRAYLERRVADAPGVADVLAAFRAQPAAGKADAVSSQRLERLLPLVLDQVLIGAAPARTLKRVVRILTAVTRRSAYFALLIENPGALKRLVDLCRQSRYIADELTQFPVLLDELIDARLAADDLSRTALVQAAGECLALEPGDDAEARIEALAQFQRATLLGIALADFSATLPLARVSDALTGLAEAVLEQALAEAWSELVAKHGEPGFETDGERHAAGFGIVAYGKLGGLELAYGSDLDIVFLNDSRGSRQRTNGAKPVDNAIFFVRLARRLVHYLTTRTRSGVLYEIDMRLRPSGRHGLLVSSLDAFTRYQTEDAWTWEHQALLRARAVAGSSRIARQFAAIRATVLRESVRRDMLRQDVFDMRLRLRRELDRSSDEVFDLKHGRGGLGDIECLVQYLVLAHAREHPELIEYSDNSRQLDALGSAGILHAADAGKLQKRYCEYRRELHRLSLNGEPPLVVAGRFASAAADVRRLCPWDAPFA